MSTPSATNRPVAEGSGPAGDPNRWLILIVIALAKFIVGLDATIVNVALPSMQRSFAMSQTELQWVVNAYALIFGGFLMLGGRLADRYGRKPVFLAGIALFVLASALNGFSQDAVVLIVGRGVQGLGGALVSPAALSILTTAFRDEKERTKALSVWGALVASGSAAGLLLGGMLTELLSWRWIFFVNLPFGLLTILVGVRVIRSVRPQGERKPFDITGALTVTAGLVMLVYVLVNGQAWGWASPPTLLFAAGAVACLVAFYVVERRTPHPLMRFDVLRIRNVAVADLVLILLTSGIFTMFFFSSLYLQGPLRYRAFAAGLAFLPATIGVMAGSTVSQRLVARFGHVAVGCGGLVLAALGMAYLARLPLDGSYAADLLPGLLPLSIGLGISFVPLTFLATAGVPDEDAGLASGLYQTVQQVGGPLGLAILSTVAAARSAAVLGGGASTASAVARTAAEVAGFRWAFAGGALILAAGAVVLALTLRRKHVPG